MKERFTETLSEKIPEGIPDDRTDHGAKNHLRQVPLSEKSPDHEHYLLPRHKHSDNRKGFDRRAKKADQIIPITQRMNGFFHPFQECHDPFLLEKSDKKERERNDSKQEGEKLSDEVDNSVFHGVVQMRNP